MTIIKSVKNFFRKALFNPFGYDIVPLRESPQKTEGLSKKKGRYGGAQSEDINLYRNLFGKDAVEHKRFYNVGSGKKFSHVAWTNVDIPNEKDHMQISWDLMASTAFPVDDSKAKIIYTSYTLEHITDEACQHFLNEAYRTLEPDGILRIIVPDIDLYYSAWQSNDRYFYFREKYETLLYPNKRFIRNPNTVSLHQNFLWSFASSVSEMHPDGSPERVSDEELDYLFVNNQFDEAMNYCTAKCSLAVQRRYPSNHVNWYNHQKLERMMLEAGFRTIYRSGYGQSRTPPLRNLKLFDFRKPEIALYVEAVK